jgi:phage-related minor tail protein
MISRRKFISAGAAAVAAAPIALVACNSNRNLYTGGIVKAPKQFRFGLMGESGPETIMPLSRGPGGKLGVHVLGQIGSTNIEIRNA